MQAKGPRCNFNWRDTRQDLSPSINAQLTVTWWQPEVLRLLASWAAAPVGSASVLMRTGPRSVIMDVGTVTSRRAMDTALYLLYIFLISAFRNRPGSPEFSCTGIVLQRLSRPASTMINRSKVTIHPN